MLVDTHCHLDMLEDLDGALERMRAAGVARAVTIGVDRASSEWAVRAARTHDQIWATVGLHPHDAKDQSDELLSYIEQLASTEQRVVGVGEAGLDYHYDNSPREKQREVYAKQVEMARRVGKVLVIHSREAWDDTFSILASAGAPERLVFHCFSGGPEEARRALDLGATLSFAGVVTFKNAQDLREAVALAPLDRIVVETDAPFLTPAPHRGKPNEPAYVSLVAEAIAAVKGVPADEVARATSANAARLFGWA
ncbi:MAG: TatD family deoxyribonuclease [Actinobacteria bacterium]|nr:MAG: TatD family deoxyribonuclease [Actinomycetota bacterium]